jgi:hypothetical protein
MPDLNTRNGRSLHVIMYYFYIFMIRSLNRGFFLRRHFSLGPFSRPICNISFKKLITFLVLMKAHLPLTYVRALLRLSFSCVNLIAIFIMVEVINDNIRLSCACKVFVFSVHQFFIKLVALDGP